MKLEAVDLIAVYKTKEETGGHKQEWIGLLLSSSQCIELPRKMKLYYQKCGKRGSKLVINNFDWSKIVRAYMG